jgi:cysteine dioxygenase
MSIVKTELSNSVEAPPGDDQPACLSLEQLKSRLSSLTRKPSLSDLNSWLSSLVVDWKDLDCHVSFKEANYARHSVVRTEQAEILMICWRPGQRTPIHDHDGSYGTVRVLRGVMWETIFGMDPECGLRYRSGREWLSGETTAGADVRDIHQIGNPDVSGQELITLHLYAPPLKSLNVYQLGERDSVFTPSVDAA